MSLKIGIIGCGHIWRRTYHPLVESFAGEVEVVAFCDINPEAVRVAAQAFPGARTYLDATELIQEEVLDAVAVLTIESVNAVAAGAALVGSVPVYLEKPPAISIAQLEWLKRIEDAGTARVFTAFNRRHVPELQSWVCPAGLRRVRGYMLRRNRSFATFPYTAVHMIDSAQYFSGRSLQDVELIFGLVEGYEGWRVHGTLGDGVECDLSFVPKAGSHCEYLVFEGERETREIHFPDLETESGLQPELGYTACFREFLRLETEGGESPHRLTHCRATVKILEDTLAKIQADLSATPLRAVEAA